MPARRRVEHAPSMQDFRPAKAPRLDCHPASLRPPCPVSWRTPPFPTRCRDACHGPWRPSGPRRPRDRRIGQIADRPLDKQPQLSGFAFHLYRQRHADRQRLGHSHDERLTINLKARKRIRQHSRYLGFQDATVTQAIAESNGLQRIKGNREYRRYRHASPRLRGSSPAGLPSDCCSCRLFVP